MRTIFVGMNEYTAALHWQVFSFAAKLPELENITRLRCVEVARDYDWIIAGGGTPYTLSAPKDRLAVVEFARFSEMRPEHLKEFYDTREGKTRPANYRPEKF